MEGKVILSFVVKKDGSLTDFKVLRSLRPDYDKEALRILKASPKWLPGTQLGKPVVVAYTMPVVFTFKST